MTSGAAVSTPDSLCGHIDDFTPPSFTRGVDASELIIDNTNSFETRYYQIRNNGEQPTLRATLPAVETSLNIYVETAGLWFQTDTSGLIFPFDGADGPCFVTY